MAAAGTRARLGQVMRSQLGVKERPRGSNKQKYGRAYGWNGVPWCAQFTWWCSQQAGIPSNVFPKTAACRVVKAFARKQGRWGRQPKVGAFVIYSFSHIGWVEKVLPSGRIQTIEGNTNGDGSRDGFQVCRRIRSSSAGVAGYFYPAYQVATASAAMNGPAPARRKPALRRVLKLRKKLMVGGDVARVQRKVGATADGEFGEQTDAKVKAFQRRHDLLADGDVGAKTAAALGFRFTG